jgi:hypothetical protein
MIEQVRYPPGRDSCESQLLSKTIDGAECRSNDVAGGQRGGVDADIRFQGVLHTAALS